MGAPFVEPGGPRDVYSRSRIKPIGMPVRLFFFALGAALVLDAFLNFAY